MRRLCTFLALALGLLPVCATAQTTERVPYSLEGPSGFERGCFGPCDCPVLHVPMAGRFFLSQVSDDGLFKTYALTDVDWHASAVTANLNLRGSGLYRIGGEVALLQQMILYLSADGGPFQRFDSGLVAGGSGFPRLDIEVPAHGFACYDTVLVVHAAPSLPTSVGHGDPLAGIQGHEPNPFGGSTRLHVALPATGRLNLSVYDARGREIRGLARGLRLGPGRYSFEWNGAADDGSQVPSGIYFVRLVWNDRPSVCRIVKLR